MKDMIFFTLIIIVVNILRGIIEFNIAVKSKFDCNKCKVFGCQAKTCMKCRESKG